MYVAVLFGNDAILFLASIDVLLLGFSVVNMALAFMMFNRSIGLFGLSAALIFPFYQGVYLKFACFFSYSAEILFASSTRVTLCLRASVVRSSNAHVRSKTWLSPRQPND